MTLATAIGDFRNDSNEMSHFCCHLGCKSDLRYKIHNVMEFQLDMFYLSLNTSVKLIFSTV